MVDPNAVLADISMIFVLRHMFAHELAASEKTEMAEIQRYFQSASVFLKASAEYFGDLLYPNAPLTQSEMNSDAAERFKKSDGERVEIVTELKSRIRSERSLDLDKLIERWLAYRDACAHFDANFWAEGGSMWPTLYSMESKCITEQFVTRMKGWLAEKGTA